MVTVAHGQNAQPPVGGFNRGDTYVDVFAVQTDGKILIGGQFTTLGGNDTGTISRNHLGRLNPDGSIDTTFNPGANGRVETFAVQPDGKILVGGAFTGLGDGLGTTTRHYVGRLNGDGSLDVSFNPPAASATVDIVVLQPDGKILVADGFTTPVGLTATTRTARGNDLARLNGDGSLDTTFTSGANGRVFAVAVQADGKILIGSAPGSARSHLARLNPDGSPDTSFNPGANNYVSALSVQPDGKILVGGAFTMLGGGGTGTMPRNYLGRLNADGSLDLTFNPGANAAVGALVLQRDGKILVGGEFTTLGGGGTGTTPRNYVGRLHADGSIDSSFDPGANSWVSAVAVQADGKILVGGIFTTLGGGGTGTTLRNRVARLNADGSLDISFNPSAHSQPAAGAGASRAPTVP
jgi:uncharacterized delta-60 repeat protein